MGSTRCILAAILLRAIFLAAFPAEVWPQTAPAPDLSPSDCFTVLLNMSDCLTFVEEGSDLTQPDKPCCSELAALVDTNPICLCKLVGNSGSFGVQIDVSRALMLPHVCQVSTPPLSFCSAAGAPSSSSPAAGAPSSSSPAPSPSGSPDTGEAQTPSTAAKNESGASSLRFLALVLLTGLVSGFVHLLV